MVESVGAEFGALFYEEGEALVCMAASGVSGPELVGDAEVARGVINYVRRTGERVVISDARRDPTFGGDPHVVARGVKSLLCAPMRHKGEVMGLLYLENTLLAGIFTEARVEMLEVQAAQANISLENARLYAEIEEANGKLEAQVIRRTEQLSEVRAALDVERERDQLQQKIIALTAERVRELSTPIIPITDKIVVIPVIGAMDEQRAQHVMETVLAGAHRRRARVVIMDLTGLRAIDLATANVLSRCAAALRLLGVQTILTGIKPGGAQTLVELEIPLEPMTLRTLQSAIARGLRMTGEYGALGVSGR